MALDPKKPTVFPTLRSQDPAKAIRFLVDALGFTQHAVHEGPDGTIVHAVLSQGNGMIMLGPGHGDGDPFDLGPNVVYTAVDDVDAHHDRAVAAGADITMHLTDQDYGSREYAATDADGNVWCFGTYQP